VGTDEERLLFYQAVTRASARLVLSWQSHDSSGSPVRPSIFLEELLDLYRDPTSGDFFAGEPPHRFLGLDAQEDHPSAPRSVRRSARSRVVDAAAQCTGAPQEAKRRAVRPQTPISDGVKRAMDGREVFSASEIEVYLQCPHRWYVQRLLQPRELDESVDAAAVGRLAHEIMRQFYDGFEARTGCRRVTHETLETARELHGEVSASVLGSVNSGCAAEEAAARATAQRTMRLVEADARLLPGFEPTFREWTFGLAGDDSPEPLGSFSLAGRVDRIDVDERRLVVTDYKLGTVDQRRAVAAFGPEGLVQLPLYALVAGRRLGLDVAGGVYRSVSGTKPRGFVREDLASSDFVRTDSVGAADVECLMCTAVERASAAVVGMRSGDIRAEPLGGKCPAYCPARGFCAEWRPGRA
jgi:RecB family exonuclease